MIVCPNCGKENQDHYKFCLGCGSDLPRAQEEERSIATPTPPTGIPAVSNPDMSAPTQAVAMGTGPTPLPPAPDPVVAAAAAEVEPAPAAPPEAGEQEFQPASRATDPPSHGEEEAAAGPITCTSCGAAIQTGFAFCGACGTPAPGQEMQGAPAAVPATSAEPGGARLVLIQPDGTEGGHVDIPGSDVAVGRDAGGFFASDPFLSPTHAVFRADGSEIVVRDAGSLNGVFIKIQPDVAMQIQSGDIFRMGQELILFEEIDRGNVASDGTEKMGSPIHGLWGRVALIVGRGRLGNAFPIGGDGVVFGRERGNILFPEDGYVSGMHLKLFTENNKFYLQDLGSSNGTFLKISAETNLPSGSFLLMGQQLFRVDV